MPRDDTDHYLAAQVASDTRPDHVCRLVHAYRIGGEDFAIDVLSDMHDVNSDEERDGLMARAEAIAADIGPIDLKTPGTLPLQEIAQILGAPETYWSVRSWVSQGAPHEGYGSTLRCDPSALAAWCAAKADGITSEPVGLRFRSLAQRLAEHAALQAA
jgi:hypothetical protein